MIDQIISEDYFLIKNDIKINRYMQDIDLKKKNIRKYIHKKYLLIMLKN